MVLLPNAQAYHQFSQQGDPLADAVVQALMQRGRPAGDMLTQVKALAEQEGGIFQAFMDQVERVPSWVQASNMDAGQALFLRCAPLSIASFVLGSLLITYTPPGSAKVLLHTGRLRQDVVRRLFETATMVQTIMQPGGLSVGAPGHQAIVRVRLLHAMVRQHVLLRGQWPSDQLGAPINQLQMALTALGFSSILINSLRRLGVAVSDEEALAYQHLWRYGNYLQGVDLQLLPATLEDEAALYALLRRDLMRPDENSRTLVAAVHEGLAWQSPFFLPRGALEAISRRLLGDELAQRLGIPQRPLWGALLALVASLHRASALRYRVPGWRSMEVRAGQRYFSKLVAKGLAGQPADYALKASH